MTTKIVLPAILDIGAAKPLFSELVALRGRDVAVDASAVTKFGGQSLQILIAAAKCWRKEGFVFEIVWPSPNFLHTLKLCGVSNDTLSLRATNREH